MSSFVQAPSRTICTPWSQKQISKKRPVGMKAKYAPQNRACVIVTRLIPLFFSTPVQQFEAGEANLRSASPGLRRKQSSPVQKASHGNKKSYKIVDIWAGRGERQLRGDGTRFQRPLHPAGFFPTTALELMCSANRVPDSDAAHVPQNPHAAVGTRYNIS